MRNLLFALFVLQFNIFSRNDIVQRWKSVTVETHRILQYSRFFGAIGRPVQFVHGRVCVELRRAHLLFHNTSIVHSTVSETLDDAALTRIIFKHFWMFNKLIMSQLTKLEIKFLCERKAFFFWKNIYFSNFILESIHFLLCVIKRPSIADCYRFEGHVIAADGFHNLKSKDD